MDVYVLVQKDEKHGAKTERFLMRIRWNTGEPIFTEDLLKATFVATFQEADEMARQYNLDIQPVYIRRGYAEISNNTKEVSNYEHHA